jgi:phenylacetate-coenzyme A ligase PaaK-like adenylate-forming protein
MSVFASGSIPARDAIEYISKQSQIESIVLKHRGVTPNYLVVVDRRGALDEVEVRIEVTDLYAYKPIGEAFKVSKNVTVSDELATREINKKLVRDIKDVIGITVKVTLVPRVDPRSKGKAKRFVTIVPNDPGREGRSLKLSVKKCVKGGYT